MKLYQGSSLISVPLLENLVHYLAKSLDQEGEIWECGVYKGGSAKILAERKGEKVLRLFDTFEGMPKESVWDNAHKEGDFKDTSLESVQEYVGDHKDVYYHKGFFPDTFKGLEDSKICFAHVDADLYTSILSCCQFIYPRLTGCLFFDDYNVPSCLGAKRATDDFFADKPEKLIILGQQALIFKNSI